MSQLHDQAESMRAVLLVAACIALMPLWSAGRQKIEVRSRHYPSGALQEEAETMVSFDGHLIYHGAWHRFSESGQLTCEGGFDNGVMTGLWRWYSDAGVLVACGEYQNDFCPDFSIMNSDGTVRTRGPKQGFTRTGVWTEWYPSGRIVLRGEFRDGQMHGLWTNFSDADPPVETTAVYDGGKRLK